MKHKHEPQLRGFILVYILVLSSFVLSFITILFSVSSFATVRLIRTTVGLQAAALADAGLEQALAKLRANASFSGETFELGNGTITTAITAEGLDRQIAAVATIDGVIGGMVTRTRKMTAFGDAEAQGQAFSFAIQTDSGGFITAKNPKITGNLYSNGNVDILGTGAQVTGNVTAAGIVTNTGSIGGTITNGAAVQPLPVIDVQGWQEKASEGLTHAGDYVINSGTPVTLGAPNHVGVITGRLLVSSNAIITLAGPVWIKGAGGSSIEISSNPNFMVASDVPQTVILADGIITLSGNALFETSGDESDLLIMTTAPGTYSSASTAVTINSNARFINAGLYAPNGTITLGPSASGLSITAFAAARMNINGNAKIDYSDGLIDANFSPDGPTGGSFTVKNGSYLVVFP